MNEIDFIKQAIRKELEHTVFEPNNKITIDRIKNNLEKYFHKNNMLYEFRYRNY
jgi:hypothetical protein